MTDSCGIWGDPGGADLIGCDRLDDVSRDEILLGIGLTLAPLALAAPVAISGLAQLVRWAYPAARVMANPKWWVTGTRPIAGGFGIAPNLAVQFYEKGPNFREYNFSSVALDYAIGASGYAFASWALGRYRVRLFEGRMLAVWRKDVIADWVKLGRQQMLFTIYSTLIGVIRSEASQTNAGATADAARMEGWLTAFKSQALQSFLSKGRGRALFPGGMDNATVACMDRVLSVAQNIAVRSYYGVVPGGGDGKRKWAWSPPSGLKDPVFGDGVGF